MMKLLYSCLVFIIYACALRGQVVNVFESFTKKPVAYAHIVYYASNKIAGGTYTNKEGKALINAESGVDSVLFSCLGYSSKKFAVNQLVSEIYLNRDDFILEEVVVSPYTDDDLRYFGIVKEKGAGGFRASEGHQIVTLIPNPGGKDKSIKSFVFGLRKRQTDDFAELKIVFFQNDGGRPGEILNDQVIYNTGAKQNKKIEVPLDSLNLVLPAEGIFAGIEWMGCLDTETPNPKVCKASVVFNWYDNGGPVSPTFIRPIFKSDEWFDVNKNMIDGVIMTPVFGLKVLE